MAMRVKHLQRRPRYTRKLALRVMESTYEQFLALVESHETIAEAERRVFLAGITAVKAAKTHAQGGA